MTSKEKAKEIVKKYHSLEVCTLNYKQVYIEDAKELFYTLENVQVDCTNLTEEQIKEMCNVYKSNGYKQWVNKDALKIEDNYTYLRIDWENEFCMNGKSSFKTIITYDKFMELFGEVVDEHTKEFISSKKQVLKYLLERDIVLTPKQYKKLWKKS